MMNTIDMYVANERYADIRRTADKHNTIKRMLAAADAQACPIAGRGARLSQFLGRVLRSLQ